MTGTRLTALATHQAALTGELTTDPEGEALARHILEFNPKAPGQRVFTSTRVMRTLGVSGTIEAEIPTPIRAGAGTGPAPVGPDTEADTEAEEAAAETAIAAAAKAPVLAAIPWPASLAPTSTVPQSPLTPDDPLPTADVLVVTWTVAEAEALADVLTPGRPRSDWQVYAHNYEAQFKDRIRVGAPARQYGRLGVYATCRIGDLSVVCLKSDLHLSQDGPLMPVRDLWKQAITEVSPRLVITTGTAGGVGATTDLGDVVVSRTVRFDCQRTFATADFAHATYSETRTPAPATHFTLACDSLFGANSAQVPGGASPRIWHAVHPPVQVLTTDFFAFDDTTDHYGLRTADHDARAVEMGDAVLGLVATQDLPDAPAWVIVRNASDPQIDGSLTLAQQTATAGRIYEKYGYWTTVNSAIVTWALIADLTTA